MASAFAPASSLAMPPPAASTAEAVDPSEGTVILEDQGIAAALLRRINHALYHLCL